MPRVLFVASEAHPLVKTGGLGDVCGSLPRALSALGADVRLLLPGYHDALERAGSLKPAATIRIDWLDAEVTLLEGQLPGAATPVWLIDYSPAYGRPGNPYLDPSGEPWYDNATRFALLARVAVAIALGRAGIRWRPQIVHGHDWQAGLVPALLAQELRHPATVFTVHNLAYQGLFPPETLAALELPAALWSLEALEFHGQVSFIKGGLAFADWITTVSPTYAHEIQTAAFGCGLQGLLRYRATHLIGIVNGIDDAEWDPARDRFIVRRYDAERFTDKLANKTALQQELGLTTDPTRPLIGSVGRLVEQKGIDLVLAALPGLMSQPVQLAVLGTGDARFESALSEAAARYPGRVAVGIGYDEGLAHRIEAGADMFLMPSRFEPCGLNQLYSLRYGTVPIVRHVGGLADTVVDAAAEHDATGIVFAQDSVPALLTAVGRALTLYRDRARWQELAVTGMRQDFSWQRSAAAYRQLYQRALRARAA